MSYSPKKTTKSKAVTDSEDEETAENEEDLY